MKTNPFLKKPLLLVLIGVLATMMVAPALATEHLLQSYPEVNDYKPGNAVSNYGYGFEITGNGEYLSRLTVFAYNETATTSTLVRGYLYNASGSEPDPTTPIDVTDQVTVNPTSDMTSFDFDFGSDVDLVSGNSYFVAVVVNGSTTGIARWHDGLAAAARASGADGWGDTWTAGTMILHYVYTDDELGGGAPYTPPGTIDTTTYDSIISGFVTFMVPLIVILLPAFLLCFITRKVDKWLLLIGLAIGAGLGYYLMPTYVPLWLVFLITIGLIGMAYQSVRGGAAE